MAQKGQSRIRTHSLVQKRRYDETLSVWRRVQDVALFHQTERARFSASTNSNGTILGQLQCKHCLLISFHAVEVSIEPLRAVTGPAIVSSTECVHRALSSCHEGSRGL